MVVILVGSVGLVAERATITAYAPGLIGIFESVGLTVRPDTDSLAIVDLQADYAGDTMRLRGKLRNDAAFFAHAPLLEVTVMSENGAALANQIIRADDDIIRPSATSSFFTQLVLEASREPTVTVTMRDDPVGRRDWRGSAEVRHRFFGKKLFDGAAAAQKVAGRRQEP